MSNTAPQMTPKEIEATVGAAAKESGRRWYLYIFLAAGGFLLSYFFPETSYAKVVLFLSGVLFGIALEKIFSDRLRQAAIQLFESRS